MKPAKHAGKVRNQFELWYLNFPGGQPNYTDHLVISY